MSVSTCLVQKTFSLLEVVITTMVMVIAIFGLCATLMSIIHLNAMTEETNLANFQARRLMEEVRATHFEQILTSYENKDISIYKLKPQESDLDGKVGKIKVKKINNDSELLEVVIRLDWQNKLRNFQFVLKSKITKMGQ